MLTFYIGGIKGASSITPGIFDYSVEDEWFNDPLVREMILEVDQTKVLSPRAMESIPLDMLIPPQMLSGGVKSLILLLKRDDLLIDGTMFGDNCLNSLVKIGNVKNVFVPLTYLMEFEYLTIPFEIRIANDNSVVTTISELENKYLKYCDLLNEEDIEYDWKSWC